MINTAKFYKFFTKGAIEQSKDAWWVASTLSIITNANQEIGNVLTFNTDLIFPETRVKMDMSGATPLANTIAKIQDDLLSTGSISTFQMAATRAIHSMRKSTKQPQTGTATDSSTTNIDLVFSSATLFRMISVYYWHDSCKP